MTFTSQKAGRLAAAAAALLLALLLFAPSLPEDRLYSLRDAGHLFLASKARAAEAFRAGTLPLWDETIDCGVPFLADPVAQAFYPGNLLFLFTSAWQGLKYFALLHCILTVLAFMFVAREFGIRGPGALLGGLAFVGCGSVVTFHYNPIWVAGFPWFLLAMAYTRRLLNGRGSWESTALLAVSVLLLLLAGAVELALAYIVYAAAEVIFALILLWRAAPAHKANRLPLHVAQLAVAGVLAPLAAAVQLLPTIELLWFSSRSIGMLELEVNIWSLHPVRLLELIAPHLFGNPSQYAPWTALLSGSLFANMPLLRGIYLGVPVLALAAAGVRAVGRPEKWMLCGMAVVTLLLSMGDQTFVFAVARTLIPAMELFRYPAKIFTVTMIPIALLAGAGANYLFSSPSGRRTVLIATASLTGLLLLITLAGWVYEGGIVSWIQEGIARERLSLTASTIWEQMQTAVVHGLLAGLVFGGLILAMRRLPHSVLLALLFSIIVFDLGRSNQDLVITESIEAHFRQDSLQGLPDPEGLADKAGTMRIGEGPFSGVLLSYQPHLASFLGYRTADPYGSLTLGNGILVDAALEDQPERALRLQSVRFAYQRTEKEGWSKITRLEDALPRALVVPRAALAMDDGSAGAALASGRFDPRQEVILSNADLDVLEWPDLNTPVGVQPEVRMLTDRSTEVVLEVDAPIKAFLLLNDTWYPGWKATVDDQPVPVYRANLSFRAVPIPAGRSRVRFSYEPDSVWDGLKISALALLVIVWLGTLPYRIKRKEGKLSAKAPLSTDYH